MQFTDEVIEIRVWAVKLEHDTNVHKHYCLSLWLIVNLVDRLIK